MSLTTPRTPFSTEESAKVILLSRVGSARTVALKCELRAGFDQEPVHPALLKRADESPAHTIRVSEHKDAPPRNGNRLR